jgi:hypothetical protein
LRFIDGETVTHTAFTQIFVPNGLPKLILIDSDSIFKGVLLQFCKRLGISYYMCAPEEHDSILCVRFHRYLNKVQRIEGAKAQTFEYWIMNTAMATYAWNASPVDGTDIIRSFAAKARTFRFPSDIQDKETGAVRIPAGKGEAAIQHVETVFPMWFQQKGLLKLLQETRRARHLQMKNESRTERKFNPGDLVLVRKQVKSSTLKGRPEKLTLKAKGPYRVLEKAGKSSYKGQRENRGSDTQKRHSG